jgi:hypothetical protein
MTIRVEVSAETEARLAAEAAARNMDVSAYAGFLLEQATSPNRNGSSVEANNPAQRTPGSKSLAQLFAESPFRGLDLNFQRDADGGRDVEL